MDDLLPVLVADLADEASIPLLESIARERGEAYVPLVAPPVNVEPHLLEIYTPATAGKPLVLRAEPLGPPTELGFPLRLALVDAPDDGGIEAPLLSAPIEEKVRGLDAEEDIETGVYLRAPVPIPRGSTPAPAIRASETPASIPSDRPRPNVAARSHTPAFELTAEHSAELSGLPIAPPSRDPFIGRTLAGGKLEIESLVGKGTMGAVYRARHRDLGMPLAIKVLHEVFQHDVDFCRRFYAEALTVSRLDHPNVVRILDFGQETDGTLYIAMEYLDGRSLRSVVEDEAPLSAPRIATLMRQVCAGLAQAHARGVIHRDVKPDNVVLLQTRDDDGRPTETVKVCDFGLALLPTSDATRERFAGTPIYMAPEQIRGEAIDGRTDVYACGVMMYELATGTVPFLNEDPAIVVALHLGARALPMSEHVRDPDPRLVDVVERALAKSPGDRHADIRALRNELKPILVPLGELPDAEEPLPAETDSPSLVMPPPAEPASPSLPPPADPVSPAPPSVEQRPSQRAAWLEDTSAQYARFLGGMAAAPKGARSEDIANVLAREPAKWLAKLAEPDPREFGHLVTDLELALRLVAKRADARAMWMVSSALHGIATDATAGQRAELARPTLKLFTDPAMLGPIAERLLAGDEDEHREPARSLVVQAGVAGAYALYGARVKHAADEKVRIPFVTVMRQLGDKCWPVVRASLERIPDGALTGEHAAAAQLAEDLLLSVPMVRDETAGHLAAKYVRAVQAPLCRAAARALARLWNERARPVLLALLSTEDDGRRIAGMVGLRQLGAVDEASVRKLAPIARGDVAASLDVRVAAISVLGVVTDSAREASIPLLAKLVRDRSGEDAVVFEAARSLIALLGNEARAVVGDRAYLSSDPLKSRLLELMEQHKGGALVEG